MSRPSQPDPDVADDTAGEAEPERGAPRWVKVTALVMLVLALLVVVLLLIGGQEHGPGRHADGGTMPSGASEVSTSTGARGSGHAPPSGGHE
jgi:hypothetical protein